jgi:hypothetical protein
MSRSYICEPNVDIFVGRQRRHVQGRTSCTGADTTRFKLRWPQNQLVAVQADKSFKRPRQPSIESILNPSRVGSLTLTHCCTTRVRNGQVWRLLQNHEREDGTLSTWLERLWKHFDIFLATVKHVLSHLAMYCWRQLLCLLQLASWLNSQQMMHASKSARDSRWWLRSK